jgi:N-acetylneuraminate synthase
VVKLFNKTIEKDSDNCFIIAEIGTNHYEYADYIGSDPYGAAIAIMKQAAAGGADAVKFQTYTAEKLAHPKYAKEQYLYMRRRDSMVPYDYTALIKASKKIGIHFMTTVFDLDTLKILGPHLEVFKVASPDITNFQLLEAINEYKKPVLVSTAGAEAWEIEDAINTLSNCNVVIMHCRAIYPTPDRQLDLGVIKTLGKEFENVIGFSSHNTDVGNGIVALALGANVLEYHFKPKNTCIRGGDYPVSITQDDLLKLKMLVTTFQRAYGNPDLRTIPEEDPLRKNGRRGLYAKRMIPMKDRVDKNDFIALRPTIKDYLTAQEIDLLDNKQTSFSAICKGDKVSKKNLGVVSD